MFLDLVKKRRSIRKYSDESVSHEDIRQILDIAMRAPTAKNRDVVQYVVVRNKEMLKKLSQYKKTGAQFLENADVAIAVVVDKEIAGNTYEQDASIAAIYIQLAAADLGLGSCWGNIVDAVNDQGEPSQEVVKKLLNIPDNFHAECVIGIGHPAEEKGEKQSLDYDSHVHEESFR